MRVTLSMDNIMGQARNIGQMAILNMKVGLPRGSTPTMVNSIGRMAS